MFGKSMNAELKAVLAELEAFGADNDSTHRDDRSKKMLNLEADAAQFISILARNGNCQRMLEIGTSNGYSTIWWAWVASQTDGHVTSIEISPDKQAMADENLKRANLRNRVDLLLGDATEIVKSIDGTFDFVFFDADRLSAPEQLKLLLPKIEVGALVLADNVNSHPEQIAGYLEAINALDDFDHMVIPVGKGISLAYRQMMASG